jgi:hypothetical protein
MMNYRIVMKKLFLTLPGGAVTLLHLHRFGLKVTVGETWRAFISAKT